MDVLTSEKDMSDLNIKENEEKTEEDQDESGCTSNDTTQTSMCLSEVDSFDLDMLFDMEKVVKNVKMKLKEKRDEKKMQVKVGNSNKLKKRTRKYKERKASENLEHLLKDDSDSSFGLTTLFEQKRIGHKRKRNSKKSNQNVKRIQEDDPYGLEWLFSEKKKGNKKNKRKNRMENYDVSLSEEDEKFGEVKVKKKRANHFVAIRVSDPAIHLAVRSFQDTVLRENEKLKPALIPLISLHLTMAVMYLDETTIKIAQALLEECKDMISEALKAVDFKLIFSGVGNFNNEIVFAKLQEKEQIECLKRINTIVTAAFEDNGISLSDKKEYNPHLTLLKLTRKSSLRKNGIKKVEESVYHSWLDSYFGKELVKKLLLCSMQGPKEEDGFYKCVSAITLSNVTTKEETDLN